MHVSVRWQIQGQQQGSEWQQSGQRAQQRQHRRQNVRGPHNGQQEMAIWRGKWPQWFPFPFRFRALRPVSVRRCDGNGGTERLLVVDQGVLCTAKQGWRAKRRWVEQGTFNRRRCWLVLGRWLDAL
jgi:hypothetical protein